MAALQDNDRYIGQLLIKDGVITANDLDRGLAEQKKNRDFLCSTLVKMGLASEEKIFSILSLQIGVPFVNLREIKIDPLALNRIPGALALGCHCLPLKRAEDCFYIAMTDPLNARAVKEIREYLGVPKIKVFLAGDRDIRESIKKYYGI